MKKKKVEVFALILWFEMVETDVKGKGLLSYPQPPPQKACGVSHELLGQA